MRTVACAPGRRFGVRELYGVMAAERVSGGYVVTSGSFTRDTKELTSARNIELVAVRCCSEPQNVARTRADRFAAARDIRAVGRLWRRNEGGTSQVRRKVAPVQDARFTSGLMELLVKD